MEQKGMTRKQFLIQSVSSYFNILLGAFWLILGIREHKPFEWILGLVFLVLSLSLLVVLFVQWRRHPLVDEALDKRLTLDFKESMKGMGIVFGIITFGFLLAFGLVALLT
ncbi:MAG: hypothetical protein IJ578_03900 [Bacteroidales bacterium]|nr:hypothetical protein [Bacteroidales bacterium]